MAAFVGVSFVGCSDDTDNPYASTPSIEIQQSNTSFSAAQNSGYVTFTSGGAVSATSNRNWCTATVKGDSVLINVEQNPSINGRAAQITLRCGADTLGVAVVQNGIKTELETTNIGFDNDDAQSVRYAMSSDVPLAISKTPDWVSARIENDTLYVEVSENTTGHLRAGQIVYNAGAYTDSVKVFQADFDKDIAGNYTLYFDVNATGAAGTPLQNKTLSKAGLALKKRGGVSLPMTYDAQKGQMILSSGALAGEDNNYSLYTVFGLDGDRWTGYNVGAEFAADLEYNDTEGTVIQFKGYISGYEVIYISLRHFKESFEQSNDIGTVYGTWYHPVLKRAPVDAVSQVSSYILR